MILKMFFEKSKKTIKDIIVYVREIHEFPLLKQKTTQYTANTAKILFVIKSRAWNLYP